MGAALIGQEVRMHTSPQRVRLSHEGRLHEATVTVAEQQGAVEAQVGASMRATPPSPG